MPSDSQFAIAMQHQREAEREEQRRIKSHILNLDFQDTNTDGTPDTLFFDPFLSPNPNLRARSDPLVPMDTNTRAHKDVCEGFAAPDGKQHNPPINRSHSNNTAKAADKSSTNRKGDRARKLKLSDVDWYGNA